MSEALNTTEEPTYPCTQCGICCKTLHTVETRLPHDDTGRCDYLKDVINPDGLPVSICSVYDKRESLGCPALNSLKKYAPPDTSWDKFHAAMAYGCNKMQRASGVHEVYRVILPSMNEE